MARQRIHVIHVGNMNNKGTQALLKSDIYVIRKVLKDPYISVSTTDVEGVKRLGLNLDAVVPPLVDIPYERMDKLAKTFHYGRNSLRYKVFSLATLLSMFIQIVLSIASIFVVELGLRSPYRNDVLHHISSCDLVVSHSDENFKESASLLPLNPIWAMTWWSMLISRTHEILVAKSFKRPTVLFPNSVGPFRTFIGRLLARLSLGNCDCILVRDSESYGIVKRLGIKAQISKILTYDTALLFETDHGTKNLPFAHPVLGVCPGVYSHSLSRPEVRTYITAHAKALDEAVERYGFFIVFLPHYVSSFEHDDLEISRSIIDKMRYKDRLELINAETVEEFKFLLEQTDMIISSKMHPAVLGASGFVPVLCIAYDHKQTNFFERLGMEYCILSVRDVSYQKLLSKLDMVWSRNNQLKTLMKEKIPEWQKDVERTIKCAITTYAKQK